MKQLTKKIVAVICVVAMLVGVIVPNGFTLNTKAADTATQSTEATDNTAREWWVYGDDDADTGLVVTDTTTGRTSGSITDAGVNLPEGLIESNMTLQIKLSVEGDTAAISQLNSDNTSSFELCNELNDCAELSWGYANFVSGENTIIFAFKDAAHANNKAVNGTIVSSNNSPFDWEETINFFRYYHTSSLSASLKITISEIKIVYTDAGLTFGADDTYLQLDSAMSATPNAVEATINIPRSIGTTYWTLRAGSDTTTTSGHTLATGTTVENDAPGAGLTYSILDATSGAQTFTTNNYGFNIDGSAYGKSQLTVAFWVYASEAGSLTASGDNQLRISSSTDGLGADFLYYPLQNITVNAGWNYISLPLDEWKVASGQNFDISNIYRLGFTPFMLSEGSYRYLCDMELIVIESESEAEETPSWTLRAGSDTTTTSGHTLATGTTVEGDAPGAGLTYSILDATSGAQTFTTNNYGFNIDASAYDKSELAVAFWIYASEAGSLTASGDNQLRISSSTDGLGADFLYYPLQNITVNAGWNYISLPLDEWKVASGQNFDISNIYRLGFTPFMLSEGSYRYLCDIELIVLTEEETEEVTEWEIFTASTVENASSSFSTGTTSSSDAPGAGMQYMILDSVSGFGTRNSNLGINAGSYTQEELALTFWVYSNTAGTLGTGDNFRLGNVTYLGETPFLHYNYGDISVEVGWNYIVLPLDEWRNSNGSGFSTEKLNCFGFTNFNLASGEIRYFGDFKIVVLDDGSEKVSNEGNIEVTKNIADVSENYMIFSNANATDESNQFALYVTDKGYPAVLYGTTQFVLQQNIATGKDVQLKAVRNSGGQIEFYLDGSLVATSETTMSSIGAPTTPYSIGADGTGAQTFVGIIKDVKTYSDASASTCTGNWPLIGDIRYVVETMPDVSGNGNNATFKGTRANDWYDVEEIGEDDWSLVFIPDIVQRFYAGEHATWHKMAKWIGENVEAENIKYVIGAKTADSAQTSAMNYGYEFFDSAVPTTNFNAADENNYYRFSVNGVKWGILSLKKGWDSDATAVFAWGKDIIAQYPYDNIIITCDNYYNSIWSEFYSENVKLIVYGSQGAEPTEDAPVMNFPAQNDLENNYFGEQGLGLMYMLHFTDGGTKVTARSYAPIYDSYFTGVVNYEKTINTVQAPEVLNVEYTGATPGVAPTDVPTGMLFAGWFKSGQVREWLLSPKNGDNFSGQSLTVDKYTTTENDEPGADMACFVLSESSTASANFEALQTFLGVDASAYGMDELALGFWVHSNVAGVLDDPSDTNWAHIRISSNDDNVSGNCLFYYMQNISVNAGWNYIEIPLSSFEDDIIGEFSLTNIDTFGITSYKVPAGMELKFGDFELIAYGAGSSKEDALTSATTGTAYARFVDKDLLTVKAQIRANTSDQSNYSDIRFVTSVDRLEYKRMGFEISYERDNGTIKEIKGGATENNIVYQKLYVVGENGGEPEGYTPKEIISANSVYFKAYTITNVPNRAFDRDFNVRAYWVTMDGTKVYGDYVDKSVWMGYQTKGEFLPVIVNTTYETDDVVIADVVLNDSKYGYVTADDVANADYDWSTALQNALTDVHNKGGGTVYVPAGQYKLTTSITIPSDVTLRGDWQDPDVGTEYGTIFNIYPTQELDVNRNADDSHRGTAAFELNGSSGVNGITVYYPEQSVSSVKKYPYTFYVADDASQLMTLKNITVLNGYRGIGTSYEVQHECMNIDNFKGTFLDCGMALYNASDAGRVTGVSISSKYWQAKDGTDASSYVLAHATGMEIGDLEWQQFSNCSVDGYNIGISVVGGYRINFAGSMVDMSITNCTTGITIAEGNDTIYYAGTDVDGKTAYPLDRGMDPRWGAVIARSTIDGNIVNNTIPKKTTVSLINYKISQTSALLRMTDVSYDSSKVSAQDYSGEWNSFDTNVKSTTEDLGDNTNAQYDATYVKPASNLWVVDIEKYDGANTDVSEVIANAMDEFVAFNTKKGYDGGILYIPGGTYRLDNPIEVPAGVELRGASSSANREQYNDCEGTLFMCYYGDDSTSTTSDAALITLAGDGAGVNGLRFIYPENIITYDTDLNSTYTISANGVDNVHVTNCYIITSSYGVNLTDCDNFYIEGVYSCVYKNTFNVSGDNGIIRGCLANPNMIVRTTAAGLTDNWPTEAKYNDTTADINTIRNSLKDNLTFINVTGGSVLIQDVTAYAANILISNTSATTVVINANADCLDDTSTSSPLSITSGTLTAINVLRTAVTDAGESATATCYVHNGGTLNIYNSIMAKADEDASAYEDNYSATK